MAPAGPPPVLYNYCPRGGEYRYHRTTRRSGDLHRALYVPASRPAHDLCSPLLQHSLVITLDHCLVLLDHRSIVIGELYRQCVLLFLAHVFQNGFIMVDGISFVRKIS